MCVHIGVALFTVFSFFPNSSCLVPFLFPSYVFLFLKFMAWFPSGLQICHLIFKCAPHPTPPPRTAMMKCVSPRVFYESFNASALNFKQAVGPALLPLLWSLPLLPNISANFLSRRFHLRPILQRGIFHAGEPPRRIYFRKSPASGFLRHLFPASRRKKTVFSPDESFIGSLEEMKAKVELTCCE